MQFNNFPENLRKHPLIPTAEQTFWRELPLVPCTGTNDILA
jgi:hypothetical protein